jgi:hypothetical protein
MDDWSKVPSRQAVSEPAPNPPTTMSHDPERPPDSACRVKRPQPGADQPCPHNRPLDPAGLARHHLNQPGAEPRNPFTTGVIPDRDADDPQPARTQTSKTARPPLTSTAPSWMTNAPAYQRTFLFRYYREADPPREDRHHDDDDESDQKQLYRHGRSMFLQRSSASPFLLRL